MNEAVADRYAQAIFEVGQEAGKLNQVAEHFQAFAKAFADSAELRSTLTDPMLDEATRTKVVRALGARIGACPEAVNAVRVMMRRRRLAELPTVSRRLTALTDERTGVVRIELKSAKPLREGYRAELQQAIEKASGRRVIMDVSIDATLIAGIVLRIGSHLIDGSVQGRLREFERKLAQAS